MAGQAWPYEANSPTTVEVVGRLTAKCPVTVVRGGPRSGRSTVLRRALSRVDPTGTTVLLAAGGPRGRRFDYAVLAHLLLSVRPGSHLDVLTAVQCILGKRSRHVLLAVDDAHLVDDSSAAVLHALALSGRATLLLVSDRSAGDLDYLPGALVDSSVVFDVPRLDADRVAAALHARFGRSADARTAHRIASAADGTPGMVEALIDDLADAGSFDVGDLVRLTASPAAGSRVRLLLERWCSGLDDSMVHRLFLLAASGPVAVMADDPAATHHDALIELAARGLVHVSRADGVLVARAHPLVGGGLGVPVGATARSGAVEGARPNGAERLMARDRRAPLARATVPSPRPPRELALWHLVRAGNVEDAATSAQQWLDQVVATDDDEALAAAQLVRGELGLLLGRLDVATAALREASIVTRDPQRRRRAQCLLAEAAGTRGDLAAADAAYYWFRSEPAPALGWDPDVTVAACWHATAAHDVAAAARLAATAASAAAAHLDSPRAPAVLHLAVRMGRPEVAMDALAGFGPRRGWLAARYAEHAAGSAAHDPAALEAVGESFAQAGVLLLAAEAFVSSASSYQANGRKVSAQRALASGRAAVAATGADDVLVSREVAGMPALTPREEEVTWLAAGGKSNRAIADRLGLSVRTVEGHLARAFVALEVVRRTELTELLTPWT